MDSEVCGTSSIPTHSHWLNVCLISHQPTKIAYGPYIYDLRWRNGRCIWTFGVGKNCPGAMHGMQASGVVEVLKLVKLNRLQEGMYTYNNTDKKHIYMYIYIHIIYDICIPDCIYIDTFFFQNRTQFFFRFATKESL